MSPKVTKIINKMPVPLDPLLFYCGLRKVKLFNSILVIIKACILGQGFVLCH